MNNRKLYFIDMLSRKIDQEGTICSKEYGTWELFNEKCATHKLVCFGGGMIFSYFMDNYGSQYDVSYVIDRTKYMYANKLEGVPVFNSDILKTDKDKKIILITMIATAIDETIGIVKRLGVEDEDIFVLPQMEYANEDIKKKVEKYNEDEIYRELCSLSYDNALMSNKMKTMSKRLGTFYYVAFHTNRMLNAVIDKLDDNEDMIREQISEKFVRVMQIDYAPDFDNPRTLNEKILAMSLEEADNPLFAQVTDKYTFKEYVSGIVGSQYVVPLIGVWDSPSEIDFDTLPEQFVIKSTNGGNSSKVILVKDKSKLNIRDLCKKMARWVNPYNSVYYENFNGCYKHVPCRIIAEDLLNINEDSIYDYKIHCFNGKPKLIHVVRQHPHQVTVYDLDWQQCDFSFGYPCIDFDVERPKEIDEMLEISAKLSAPFKYVRVDFYLVDGRIYVGELTLTHMAGMGRVTPNEWDEKLGDMIE